MQISPASFHALRGMRPSDALRPAHAAERRATGIPRRAWNETGGGHTSCVTAYTHPTPLGLLRHILIPSSRYLHTGGQSCSLKQRAGESYVRRLDVEHATNTAVRRYANNYFFYLASRTNLTP